MAANGAGGAGPPPVGGGGLPVPRTSDLESPKAESNSNVSSRAAVPKKPKVLALGLYAMTPKYIPPQKRNSKEANTPLPRKETVSLVKKTNVCVNLSTGIKFVTEVRKSKSKCETKTHRNFPARSKNVKRVDNPLRNLNKRNRVDSSLSVKRTGFISKSVSVCKTCNECLVFGNHNKCGIKNLNSVNTKNPKVKNNATVKQVWKATGKIFASVGSKWRPTERKFTLGDTCPLTRITKPEVVPLEKSGSVSTSEPANNVIVTSRFSKKPLTIYKRKDRKLKDISTGSPSNTATKAVNDPVNDDYNDELFNFETVNNNTYDDPFDSEEEKIKESKLLINKLDLPGSSDFLPSPECDSVFYEDFSEVDVFSSTNNEDKVFNPGILIHGNLFEVTIRATPDKNVKKIAISNVSLILEDFNPPLYELFFHKEVPGSETLLSFSFENEEKVFNPEILTSKGVHTSFLPKLSHQDTKAFKVIKIFESPMEIFPCSYGEDIRVLDVP
ncbi:hypothetical protein Tco_0919812, partial [Tanacetum coccineum]